MKVQYFDSNAPANGDGSIEHPKKTSAELDAFLKEDGDKTLFIKAGSLFDQTVPFNSGGCAVHVLACGHGPEPIIRNDVFEITKTFHVNPAE